MTALLAVNWGDSTRRRGQSKTTQRPTVGRRVQTTRGFPEKNKSLEYYSLMRFALVLKWIRRAHQNAVPRHPPTERNDDEESLNPAGPFPDLVEIEFRDVIDLHSIPPGQVSAVVEDYIDEAHRRGVRWVRIIHGKGIGVQREMVRSILSRTNNVIDFRDAPQEAGGWGATVVTLSTGDKPPSD